MMRTKNKNKNLFSLSFNECGYVHPLGRLAYFIERSNLSRVGGRLIKLSEKTSIEFVASYLSPLSSAAKNIHCS